MPGCRKTLAFLVYYYSLHFIKKRFNDILCHHTNAEYWTFDTLGWKDEFILYTYKHVMRDGRIYIIYKLAYNERWS